MRREVGDDDEERGGDVGNARSPEEMMGKCAATWARIFFEHQQTRKWLCVDDIFPGFLIIFSGTFVEDLVGVELKMGRRKSRRKTESQETQRRPRKRAPTPWAGLRFVLQASPVCGVSWILVVIVSPQVP